MPTRSRQFLYFPQAKAPRSDASEPGQLISVVLPVYNQAALLTHSVRSVLAQEECNLELIVVDDGSTDDVAAAIAPFRVDTRLKFFSQHNQGLSAALNRGFRETQGEFLTWTSADNLYLPGALSTLSRFLVANPNVGMAYGNVQLINDDGEILRNSNYRSHEQDQADSSVLLLPIEGNLISELPDNFINACFLYRRDLYSAVGDYDPALRGVEDYDYWLRISRIARIQHVATDQPLYQYRLHGNTLTASINSETLAAQTENLVSRHRAMTNHDLPTKPAPTPGMVANVLTPYLASGPPALLRRARSSDFGAVVSTHANQLKVLVPLAEHQPGESSPSELLSDIVSSNPETVFAILCCSRLTREVADEVNRTLSRNQNLRIIDLTAERETSGLPNRSPALFPDPFVRALMFSLSSVDGVLVVDTGRPSNSSLSSAINWTAVAAAAGRSVVWLEQFDPEQGPSPGPELTGLRSKLIRAPHLTSIKCAPECDVISRLPNMLTDLCSNEVNQGELDEWLDSLRNH